MMMMKSSGLVNLRTLCMALLIIMTTTTTISDVEACRPPPTVTTMAPILKLSTVELSKLIDYTEIDSEMTCDERETNKTFLYCFNKGNLSSF